VSVLTTHLIPFRRFNVDTSSEEAAKVFSDVQKKLKVGGTMLLQGDFNINSESLQSVLSDMFAAGVQEVWQIDPTTPKGHRYDHVLFRGMRNTSSSTVSSVQTDHYPIVSTFELL
jgi:endonuclease/exonuclease/phosphatase (EEP) superfamily protein YafD